MNSYEESLRGTIVGQIIGRPIVQAYYIEPPRRWVLVDKDRARARVGLEFREDGGQAEQWLARRFLRKVLRNDEFLMIGKLRICGLCALPMVDEDVCPANQYGSSHEEFIYGGE